MIDPENPLKLPKSVDDSRAALDERTVLADTLHHWRSRYGVDPSDMPSVEGSAILAAVTWREALHDDDIVERALSFAADLGSEARDKVVGMLAFVSDAPERARTDTLVAASAARLKRASAIRAAERREAEALKAVEAEPTPETRRAYREAMEAVDEAHLATPARRRSLSDMVGSSLDRMRAGQGKTCVGILTPLYPKLSNALFGWRGLVVVAAAPGLGKTTLALSAALDAVEANPDTCMLFASFEMPTATLVDRLLSQMSGVPQRVLRVGSGEREAVDGFRMSQNRVAALAEARERLDGMRGRVGIVGRDDIGKLDGPAPTCMSKLAQMVEDMKAATGASRSFVVVDYLGVVPVELPGGAPFPNETERIRHALSGLVGLRDRLGEDNPVVVVAQARKGDWKSADLASVMGTADTTYSADACIVMQREGADKDTDDMPSATGPQPVVARIVKGRDMMHYATVRLSFDPTTSTLSEVRP